MIRKPEHITCPGRLVVFTLISIVTLVLCSRPVVAGPINLSFETGDLGGWDVTIPLGLAEFSVPIMMPTGTATVRDSLSTLGGTVLPIDGTQMAMVEAGNAGARFFVLNPNPIWDIFISQNVTLEASDVLSGWAFFFNDDGVPQDSAWVKVLDQHGNELARPWVEYSGTPGRDPASVGEGFATPWTLWQWQAPTSGVYTLAMGVTTNPDNTHNSYGGFDAVSTPEPSSLVLIGVGGLLTLIRRRKAAARTSVAE